MKNPSKIAVIGGGPAGLIAADRLSRAGHRVTVFDRMPSLGRKLLMAGRGGLNLTHSEPLEVLLKRYHPTGPLLKGAIRAFQPDALRAWCGDLGQETFIGTSGRVFPKAMKASPLLRALLSRLAGHGVEFFLRHSWKGWGEDGQLAFDTPDGPRSFAADGVLLALGGASWPRLGADGSWTGVLGGIDIAPLEPANSGVLIGWSEIMRTRHAGSPLKRIVARVGDAEAQGEAIITEHGLEGGVIYALSRVLREAIARDGHADLVLDLRPDFRAEWIAERLGQARKGDSLTSKLRKAAGIQPNAVTLVHEAALKSGIALQKADNLALARFVKALPLRVTGIAGLERAISTAGGVRFGEIDGDFMLKKRPGVFVAGEMLDWEAPTGGYLLQACFSTGLAAAEGLIRYLNAKA